MTHKALLILMFLFVNVFGEEQSIEDSLKMTGSIINVVMNQKDSIAGLHGDKLYLKAQNIFHSKNGYILRNEQSVIALPTLSFDAHGEGYLLCRSPEDFKLTCSNPNCGYVFWFSETWNGHCPKCGCMGN